ncbi:MAG: sulfatase-like hydrolase/transferase [Prolixibacteraceae bacterium]
MYKSLLPYFFASAVLLASCTTKASQEMDEQKPRTKYVSPATGKPNIIWISCEDISSRLGCYDDPVAQTPNIDRLCSEGAQYTNVFTVSPVCAPNRSAIITGMYHTTIGTHHMRTSHKGRTGELPTPYSTVPPHYVKAFPEYLRSQGYYCTNNVKTDYQFSGFGDVPVSIWDESSTTAHYKNRKDKDQPFFAVFNYTMTHESKTWQEPEMTDPSKVTVPPYYPDTEPVRRSIARLYDQIAKLDTVVGKHLQELEEEGLAENTIVFFWSDHGDGLPRGKRWPYDSGTKVPLIVRWPGVIEPGTVIDDLISSIDLGPTVLSLANVPVPAHMQGKAFLGNQTAEPWEYVFSARDRFDESYDMVRSVRDKKWRYMRNYYPNEPYVIWVPYRNQSPIMQELLRLKAEDNLNEAQELWFRNTRPPEELYDTENDPYNIHNLADDPEYQDVLKKMRGVLDEWRIESRDMGDISEYQMKEIMWPGGEQPVTSVPHFVPNTKGNRNADMADEGGTLTAPALMSLYCATQGASMVYTLDEGDDPEWKIYNGPFMLKSGSNTIRAKAIRYGFKHSDEVEATFSVE